MFVRDKLLSGAERDIPRQKALRQKRVRLRLRKYRNQRVVKARFLLPVSEIQAVFPARANLRFDGIAKLSPLYMVAQNRKHDGEITVQVLKDGVVLEEATERVTVLAFDECNVDKPESIATFVRRTPDVNRLLNLAHKKIAEWGFKDVTGTGYANASKTKCEISAPRRMRCFATMDSLWARKRRRTASSCPIFGNTFGQGRNADGTCADFRVGDRKRGIQSRRCEIGQQLVRRVLPYRRMYGGRRVRRYVLRREKAAAGVGEATLIDISGIFKGESFEKCEKNAVSFLKNRRPSILRSI